MTVAGMEGVEPSSRLADGSVLREVPRKMNPAEREVRCTDRNRFGLVVGAFEAVMSCFPSLTFARSERRCMSCHCLACLACLSDGRLSDILTGVACGAGGAAADPEPATDSCDDPEGGH